MRSWVTHQTAKVKEFGYSQVTKITVPKEIENLGEYAFAAMYSLKTVIYEEGITNLGIDAFVLCTNIEYFELPSSITKVVKESTGYGIAERGYILIKLDAETIINKQESKEWFFPDGVEIRDKNNSKVVFSWMN